MADLCTADRVLAVLESAGVDTVFGLPGVHNLPFWHRVDATGRHGQGLRIIGVRHEQTAAFAADGLARATGGLGVALVTSGPGAANTLTAFGEAAVSGIPLLVIASDVPEQLRERGHRRGLLHESKDPGAWFSPMAKAVLQPTNPADAVAAAARAVAIAMAHPRGPVYLGIPADVLAESAPAGAAVAIAQPATPSPEAIASLAKLVNEARRPVLWVGGGAVSADAATQVDELAWRLGAPVLSTFAGRGLLASGHPLLVDVPPHEPLARDVLAAADLLIGIGSAFDGPCTANWSLPRPARVADINLVPSGAYTPDVVVTAHVTDALDDLTIRLRGRAPWADSPFHVSDVVRRGNAADERTAEAVAIVDAVDLAWPRANAIVCDMAVAGYWVGGYAAVGHPRHLLYPIGWGTLGYGLPAGIGVAASGIPCLAVLGDGGFVMAMGELGTVAEQGLPLTMLVVDDSGYGMLRYDQRRAGHPERGVDLVVPHWRSVGEAYRIRVDEPNTPAELSDALAWSAASGEPRLIVYRASLFPPRSTSPRWADTEDKV